MDNERAWELPPPTADAAQAPRDQADWALPGQIPSAQPGGTPEGQVPPGPPGWAPQGQVPPGYYAPGQATWAPPGQAPGWDGPDQRPGQATGWTGPGYGQVPGWAPPGQAPGWGPQGQQGWVPPGQAPGWAPPDQGMYPPQAAPYGAAGWGAAGAPMPMQVAAKSPALHALASAFVPGLGSMLAGNGGIGALILVTYVVGWFLALVVVGFPILIGAWIWGIVNGHSSAVTWNRKHGIIS